MNIRKLIILFIFLVIPKLAVAGTMTASGNADDYAMTRASAPDVFDGLVFRAPMNQGAGSGARDVSGYGANGTITGATWVDVDGRRCLSFDGITNRVNCGDPADGHLDFLSSFSITAYLKIPVDASISFKTYLGKYDYAGTSGYDFSVQNGKLRSASRGSSNLDTGSVGNDLRDNIFHHIAIICTTTKINTFVDGVQVATSTGTWVGSASANPLIIGARQAGGSEPFYGWIDDPRIYDRALSAGEVYQTYMATKQ